MPIEVKEIVFRATLTDGTDSETAPRDNDEFYDEVVQTCVNQVLRILERKHER